ncbi:type VI secretion system protein ImpL [Paucimonas lemoignei]|uniref:Type VI secretion system protein ImpL n=1 Tax=Paucimonas lemoignei TaxID=29443 RepID=A0A4R3I1K7_PAULE|nr:type VI secretion system membrane subunit TssM [Paucimonas lemoignei]TCS39468.1 type VI secretion system protein ImpL [Paucimonas lemoignei]
MNRLFSLFRDARFASAVGLLFILVAIYVIGTTFDMRSEWLYIGWTMAITAWIAYLLIRWFVARRAGKAMESMFATQVEDAVKLAPTDKKQEIDILKKRLLEAVHTIKNSKLGQRTGSAALYEMPWYIVIGNPAAGKSTAVLNSGLNFPFSDKGGQSVQGIGGTRNCDWFFTTEGILLDTAGRYAVQEEDREEWFGFLKLLKKYRPKAPINGIVIVASIAELCSNRPDVGITLARELRQRVQELTERLELFAPVYVVFTKVDLIAGFVDFFEDSDAEERSRVWGATLPYDGDGKANAISHFDQHFDKLAEGIKELGTTRMSLNRSEGMSPGVLTFPLEFVGVKHHLRTFIATLFEDNPYQFKPIFRGFYFTSAIQEGVATHATGERIVQQFSLSAGRRLTASISSNTGFFLKNLFSSVIFADRNLVRQYASRSKIRLRYATFYGAVLALGLVLGGWSWSFVNNQQYMANIQADLDHARKVQENRVDLASRLEALGILQDRLQQLKQYHDSRPLALTFGLYQGDRIEHKLRAEYFKGLQQVMLQPVAANLESFLAEVIANAGKLEAPVRSAQGGMVLAAAPANNGPTLYKDALPGNAEDAYKALKTYLMLGNRDRIDPGHLNDQLTRFWRNWLENNRGTASREQVVRHAEKLISFYLAQADQPDFPLIDNKLALVDQVRDTLKPVVKGTPARERVYSEIRMRAATRFPIVTVASIVGEQHQEIVAGSHTVSGAFTRAAWEQYVEGAIKEASTKELQSTDWVLKTSVKDDLSLEGSPEQIQKELVRLYKADYVNEWKKFMQGILIKDFAGFDNAVQHMNVLGDPQSSPISALLQTLYHETSWDNPSLVSQGLQGAKRGLLDWFRETVLRQTPNQVRIDMGTNSNGTAGLQTGIVGKEFAAIANLVVARGDNKDLSLMKGYLDHLSKVRTRFNQINNAGDFGPASRQLMQATMDGNGSELADALKYIDENMLTGMPAQEKATIRPLLVRPLMQAFAVIIAPAERELNRTWMAQVYEPFNRSLASKYPFAADSRVEATPGEISQVFGPDGAISKYVQSAMGPLVIRRGDTLATRTWADMGVRLNPQFSANLARYVAAQGHAGTASSPSGNAGQAQTNFQLLPIPTPGLLEYSVEIDGQLMRYRNGQQEWHSFAWPNVLGQPGAKITAVTNDGRTVEIVNFPGQFGLEKFINSAQRKKLDNGIFHMSWDSSGHQVSLRFRLISDARPGAGSNGAADTGLRGLALPASVAGEQAEAAAPAAGPARS